MQIKAINVCLCSLLLLPLPTIANTQQYFEQIFATSVLLTNAEAITFGVSNFDPSALINPSSGEQEESVNLRNQLKIFSLPYTYDLDVSNEKYYDQLNLGVSYIKQEQNLENIGSVDDFNSDTIYTAYFAFTRNYKLNNFWTFRTRLGSHLMHHKNSFDYNSMEAQEYRELLDGEYFNVESNAFIVEPNIRFTYDKQQEWGSWLFSSDYNYFYGWTFAGSDSSKGARPEGWEIANTLKSYFTLYDAKYHAESLYVKAERVDIGGDIKPSLETSHYYEFGIGLLLNTSKVTSWVNNVGIGVNLNVGSSLSGGSIVLYYNE